MQRGHLQMCCGCRQALIGQASEETAKGHLDHAGLDELHEGEVVEDRKPGLLLYLGRERGQVGAFDQHAGHIGMGSGKTRGNLNHLAAQQFGVHLQALASHVGRVELG